MKYAFCLGLKISGRFSQIFRWSCHLTMTAKQQQMPHYKTQNRILSIENNRFEKDWIWEVNATQVRSITDDKKIYIYNINKQQQSDVRNWQKMLNFNERVALKRKTTFQARRFERSGTNAPYYNKYYMNNLAYLFSSWCGSKAFDRSLAPVAKGNFFFIKSESRSLTKRWKKENIERKLWIKISVWKRRKEYDTSLYEARVPGDFFFLLLYGWNFVCHVCYHFLLFGAILQNFKSSSRCFNLFETGLGKQR